MGKSAFRAITRWSFRGDVSYPSRNFIWSFGGSASVIRTIAVYRRDFTCNSRSWSGQDFRGVDLQESKGPALQPRWLREHRKGVVGCARNRCLVERQGSEVGEQRCEAVDRKPVRGEPAVRLRLGGLGGTGRFDRGFPSRPRSLPAVVPGQERSGTPPHVPFRVTVQHEREHMGPDMVGGVHVDGTDIQPGTA